jgi:acetoin utilization protein AcuA
MGSGQSTRVETKRGQVLVSGGLSQKEVEALALDQGIGVFPSYRSLLTSRESLAQATAQPGTYLCLCLAGQRRIVGFTLQRPSTEGERWARLKPPVMDELLSEVARGWRDLGLMRPMLDTVVSRPENDERILYILGYSWHWDLDGTGKTLQAYRDTLIHMLSPLGFRQYPTNEANISLRPENLFMARVGDKVSPELQKRFTNLLFGMED